MRAGLYRGGGIGDNLMAACVFKALRDKYEELDVLSTSMASVVYENNPHVTRLIIPEEQPIKDAWNRNVYEYQKWFDARGKEYDGWFNLNHSCESTGALQVIQTAFWTPAAYRRKLCNRNYLEIVADICGAPYDFNQPFYPTPAELAQAMQTKKEVGDQFIAWVVSGSRIDKLYPYSALAVARLLKEVGPVVVFGGPGKDHQFALEIEQHVKRVNSSLNHFHQAISPPDNPIWPIRRTLSMIQQASLVIGVDTGLMWATAFEDMPKIMLLSHASPENITKHWRNAHTLHADPDRVPCWPCHRLHEDESTCVPNADKQAAACMTDIPVDTIVSLASTLMKG